MVSLDSSCVAIRHVHRTHRLANPCDDELVRQVRLGLRRTYGTAPRRQARPLTVPEIRQIITAIDRTTPIGARNAAMILLGYASAMRGSEIVALNLADIETKPAGLLITIRSSKTDQEHRGQVVARMLRERAVAAGLDGTRVTAHSLRAGHAAAMDGVPLTWIAAQTRHKDLGVLVNRYIRPLEALATTSSRDIGL